MLFLFLLFFFLCVCAFCLCVCVRVAINIIHLDLILYFFFRFRSFSLILFLSLLAFILYLFKHFWFPLVFPEPEMKSIVHFRPMRTFSIVGLFGVVTRENRRRWPNSSSFFFLHLLSVVNNGKTNDRKWLTYPPPLKRLHGSFTNAFSAVYPFFCSRGIRETQVPTVVINFWRVALVASSSSIGQNENIKPTHTH